MSRIFSKAKSVRPPPVPPPPPIPEVGEEPEVLARKRARGRRGFMQTIITGALAPETGKKTVLG